MEYTDGSYVLGEIIGTPRRTIRKCVLCGCTSFELIGLFLCLMFLMTNVLLVIFILDTKHLASSMETMLTHVVGNFTNEMNNAIQNDLTFVMSYLQNNFTLHVAVDL
jgi:hypothetical protein